MWYCAGLRHSFNIFYNGISCIISSHNIIICVFSHNKAHNPKTLDRSSTVRNEQCIQLWKNLIFQLEIDVDIEFIPYYDYV